MNPKIDKDWKSTTVTLKKLSMLLTRYMNKEFVQVFRLFEVFRVY